MGGLFTKTKTEAEAEAEAEAETVGCLLRRRSSREEAARVSASASHPRQFSQSQRQPRDTNNKMVNLKSTAFFFFCLFVWLFGKLKVDWLFDSITASPLFDFYHSQAVSEENPEIIKEKDLERKKKKADKVFIFIFIE